MDKHALSTTSPYLPLLTSCANYIMGVKLHFSTLRLTPVMLRNMYFFKFHLQSTTTALLFTTFALIISNPFYKDLRTNTVCVAPQHKFSFLICTADRIQRFQFSFTCFFWRGPALSTPDDCLLLPKKQ